MPSLSEIRKDIQEINSFKGIGKYLSEMRLGDISKKNEIGKYEILNKLLILTQKIYQIINKKLNKSIFGFIYKLKLKNKGVNKWYWELTTPQNEKLLQNYRIYSGDDAIHLIELLNELAQTPNGAIFKSQITPIQNILKNNKKTLNELKGLLPLGMDGRQMAKSILDDFTRAVTTIYKDTFTNFIPTDREEPKNEIDEKNKKIKNLDGSWLGVNTKNMKITTEIIKNQTENITSPLPTFTYVETLGLKNIKDLYNKRVELLDRALNHLFEDEQYKGEKEKKEYPETTTTNPQEPFNVEKEKQIAEEINERINEGKKELKRNNEALDKQKETSQSKISAFQYNLAKVKTTDTNEILKLAQQMLEWKNKEWITEPSINTGEREKKTKKLNYTLPYPRPDIKTVQTKAAMKVLYYCEFMNETCVLAFMNGENRKITMKSWVTPKYLQELIDKTNR